jgi:retron-type reverse transcriptase
LLTALTPALGDAEVGHRGFHVVQPSTGWPVYCAKVARKVTDKRVLRLIRRYLEAGIMVAGVRQSSGEGTPQGSPLSPLLANVMLDDLARELQKRGHHFVRYADDLRVHVKTELAGQRVLEGVTGFVERRLKLKVNRRKFSVKHAARATVLVFGFEYRHEEAF